MSGDLPYWLALTRFRPFGAVRMGLLARRFESMQEAFEASVTDLLDAGITPKLANRFLQERIHLDPEEELRLVEKHNVQVITLKDPNYPELLKEIYHPPAVLFIQGTLPPSDVKHLAVVGSRKATSYGSMATRRIVEPLAQSGVVIVSGLAYGIDAVAHTTALDVDGITLAVLGSGLDEENIYPSQHRTMASTILSKGGALITEFPIGTRPLPQNFPFRNRIISGLSHGTLVVEGAIKSGSLITARAALEQGRDVYAVPGPINAPLSEGPNSLIKLGASPVTEPVDIFDIKKRRPQSKAYSPETDEEGALFNHLDTEPKHIDELVRLSELPIHVTSSTLTLMEMKGVAHHEGGRYYTKAI